MWPPIIQQHSALSASTNRTFSGGAPMLTLSWVGKGPPSRRTMTPFRRHAPTTIAHRPNALRLSGWRPPALV